MDKSQNLYGTTAGGGSSKSGTVFQLVPPATGSASWKTNIIFSFGGATGATPYDVVSIDTAGNLYGTTSGGGSQGYGAVFELAPPVAGTNNWTETVLASFNGTNGAYPVAGVTLDGAGNLYGTAVNGGAAQSETVFGVKR